MEFVTKDTHSTYTATQLGKAIVASAIDPDDGVFIHKELSRALRAFVMDGDMHILYTFTPVQESGVQVNWQVFRNEMEGLDESGMRVLSFLGLKPTTILRLYVPICHAGCSCLMKRPGPKALRSRRTPQKKGTSLVSIVASISLYSFAISATRCRYISWQESMICPVVRCRIYHRRVRASQLA